MERLREKIERLKTEQNAVILAHFYVPDEVKELADYIGDSYYLAKLAASTDAETLVFCGVHFMGESAKLLNPSKRVLLPELSADCPMAHMAGVAQVEELRKSVPDLAVVCYINSTAELKAHCDVCVTSSNALKIVRALKNKNILFIPDENLGRYIAEQVPEKNFYYSGGYCHVHARLTPEAVLTVKAAHPDAEVLAHPECKKEVLSLADYIGSTAGMIARSKESRAKEFIVCTEGGVLSEMRAEGKRFYIPRGGMCCPNMKKISAEKVLNCLETGEGEIELNETLRERAAQPLKAMLELAGK